MDADSRIIAALTESPPPGTAAPAVQSAWERLQSKLAEYDECVAISRNAEGLSLSMSVEAAAKQVAEYHAAYRQILAGAGAADGTAPELLAGSRGYTVDFSRLSLHRL